MTESENGRPRLAGGIFIALGLLTGAIGGIAMNQPSAGMVIGMGVGSVIAIIIWFQDRKQA